MKKAVIVLTFFSLILSSCEEPNSEDIYRLPEFWGNLLTADMDSTATANNLIGTWKLTHVYCCPESTTGGQLNNVEDQNYQLQISSQKISIFVNGQLTQESTWELLTQNQPAFKIETEPFVPNTWGQIFFAENMLLFYGSPSDGSDNYFERISEN